MRAEPIRLLLINLHAMMGNEDEVSRLFDEVLVDFRDTDVLFQVLPLAAEGDTAPGVCG